MEKKNKPTLWDLAFTSKFINEKRLDSAIAKTFHSLPLPSLLCCISNQFLFQNSQALLFQPHADRNTNLAIVSGFQYPTPPDTLQSTQIILYSQQFLRKKEVLA